MVTKADIDTSHSTYWNTCLMSNYGVCCSYFTKKDVNVFFEDYFKEFDAEFLNPAQTFNNQYLMRFNLPAFAIHYNSGFANFILDYQRYKSNVVDIRHIMNNYASIFTMHYHLKTYTGFIPYNKDQGTDIGGYPIIKILHENISQVHFSECRNMVRIVNLSKDKNGDISNNVLGINNVQELITYMENNEVLLNAFNNSISHSLTIYCDSVTKTFYEHNTNTPANDTPLQSNWINAFGDILLYERI